MATTKKTTEDPLIGSAYDVGGSVFTPYVAPKSEPTTLNGSFLNGANTLTFNDPFSGKSFNTTFGDTKIPSNAEIEKANAVPNSYQFDTVKPANTEPAAVKIPEFNYGAAPTFNYSGSSGGGGFNYGAAPTYNYQKTEIPVFSFEGTAPTFNYTGSSEPLPEFSYENAPQYTNAYQEQINQMIDGILNKDAFSYDVNTDPLYAQYKDQYTRLGNQAMTDTLGQVSARTGGLASSYAGTAAQNAYNGYMQQLADKVPELYQLAYSMYQDRDKTERQNLAMIQALEDQDYSRYADLLNQYNNDRNFAYGQYTDKLNQQNNDRNFQYNMYQDQLAQYNNDRNFAYGQYSDMINQQNNDRNFEYNLYRDQLSQYNNDRNFAYGQYQDQIAQQNADRNFAYKQYQDQLSQYNKDKEYAYDQYLDSVAAALGSSGSTSSSSGSTSSSNETVNTTDIFQQMKNAGIKTEAQAYNYLVSNELGSTSEREKLAQKYMSTMDSPAEKASGVLSNIKDSIANSAIGKLVKTVTTNAGYIDDIDKIAKRDGKQSAINYVDDLYDSKIIDQATYNNFLKNINSKY